jgi:hypothetical protein
MAVDTTGGDVSGVTFTLWPGQTIGGRISIDGRAQSNDPDVTGITVTLRRSPPVNSLPESSSARVPNFTLSPDGSRVVSLTPDSGPTNRSRGDGTFSVSGVPPGDYAVNVAVKDDAYVEAIRLGARDVLNGGLHVNGPVTGSLEIVLGVKGGSIEGTALDVRRAPAANVVVVAVPDGSRRGRTDLFKVASTDDAGRFRLRGLAPGQYEVFAWDDIEPGAWQDADAMKAYAGLGRIVRIEGGAKATVEVTTITSDR